MLAEVFIRISGHEYTKTTPQVGSIYLECGEDCFDPTTAVVYQDSTANPDVRGTTPSQLVFVSQENPVVAQAGPPRYFFDDSAGEDVPVFIVDSGASLDHKASSIY